MAIEYLYDHAARIALSDNVLMTLLVVPVVLVAEWLRPAHRVTARHYRFGAMFFAVNMILLGVVAPVINLWTALGVQALGFGLIDLRLAGFDGVSGSLMALLVSTVVLDFFYYWFHRCLHKSRIMWQAHLLHHSDDNMNTLTAQRGHIFEALMAPFFITLPMAVLFDLPALDIAILSLLPQAYQFIVHANIRMGYGRLWWLIISPDYHRIHHSIEARHRDKNFTNWFPIWDILFGTLHLPARNERPQTGVAGVTVSTLWRAYVLPIEGWWAMASDNGRKRMRPMADDGDLRLSRDLGNRGNP